LLNHRLEKTHKGVRVCNIQQHVRIAEKLLSK